MSLDGKSGERRVREETWMWREIESGATGIWTGKRECGLRGRMGTSRWSTKMGNVVEINCIFRPYVA